MTAPNAFLVDANSTITPRIGVAVDPSSGVPTMLTVDGSGNQVATAFGGGGGGGGDMYLANTQTVTGTKTFNSGKFVVAGSTSGTITLNAAAVAGSNTITLPATTDTVVTVALAQTLTNKTLTAPTFTSPVLGTPASGNLANCNGVSLTSGVSGILPVANGGTGTATPALVAGTNVTISGTWPNQTINASGGGGGVSISGTPSAGQAAEWTNATTVQGVVVTGTGNYVKATSPTLVTPALGTPSAMVGTNVTGIPLTTGVTGVLPAANMTAMVASGASHSAGIVPDPGASAGSTRYLCENATWSTPAGGGNVSNTGTPTSGQVGVWTSATVLSGVTATGTGSPVLGTGPTISAATLSGIVTTDGANVTTAAAMGALAIDVTKGLNTKTIAADSTFTFSGTPATANTWFSVHVTNSDTNPHTLTIPSAFSLVTQAARTTCIIPASGQLWMMFRYDGSAYHVFGDGPALNNFTATTNPGTGNDTTQGYAAGSLWGNTSANTLYWCESAATGAAVWNSIGGGSGDMLLGTSQTVTAAKTFNDATLVLAGSTSGTLTLHAAATAGSGSMTFPTGTDTVATLAATQTLTNKTLTAPTMTAPALGTPASGNLSSCTADGTNAVGFLGSPLNSQSAAYTLVLADAGKTIYHPSADTTARTFTIPANASVAFPIGTVITFDNDISAGALTIAITTDTLVLVGAAGSTGSRTLAAGGRAVAQKVTSTRWRISGSAELT